MTTNTTFDVTLTIRVDDLNYDMLKSILNDPVGFRLASMTWVEPGYTLANDAHIVGIKTKKIVAYDPLT